MSRISIVHRARSRLLHNLTSNKVKKMAPGAGCQPTRQAQADPLGETGSLGPFDLAAAPPHSSRNAVIGSIPVARRAGR